LAQRAERKEHAAAVARRPSARFNAYPKTDGDCPDFAEPAKQKGTVPFSQAVFG
jgi:hypothetical protein